MRSEVRRLDALTGLRFVAAAAVVVHHMKWWAPGQFGVPGDFGGDFPLGPSAVGFFFVLSGFILAYVYPRLDTPADAARFFLARFARLYPAHLCGLLLSMVVAGSVFWPAPTPPFDRRLVLAAHAGLVQSWVPVDNMTSAYNGPSWSIATEFAFYLFFVPLVRNWPRTWWWKLALTAAVPAAVVAAANIWDWPFDVPKSRPSFAHFLSYSPPARLYQFVLGMATALVWQRVGPRLRVGPVVGTVLEVAAVALLVAAIHSAGQVGVAAMGVPWLGLPAYHLLHGSALFVAGPCAVLIFVFANEWGWVSRALATRPAVVLGDISFGLYILHAPLLMFAVQHKTAFQTVPAWQVGVGFWAVLLLVSHWMYVVVERPARGLLVGLWPGGLAVAARSRVARHAVETAALAAVVAGVLAFIDRETFRYLDPAQVDRLVEHAPAHLRGPRFADCYRLRGATFVPAEGGLQLRLVWESLKGQPPWFHVWVQFTDPAPAEECRAAVVDSVSMGADRVPPGRLWEQRLFLPAEKLAGAANVVLIVWNKDETGYLPVFDGPTDAHGRLLLNPGPPPAPPPPPPPPAETFRYVSDDEAERLVEASPANLRGVRFGDTYQLLGATFAPEHDGVRARFVWESLKEQPPWFHVWVQFNDPPPVEACRAAVWGSAAMGPERVPAGTCWEQTLHLPNEKLAAATRVALVVWNKDETAVLPVSGGPVDANGRLRLEPLAAVATEPPVRPAD